MASVATTVHELHAEHELRVEVPRGRTCALRLLSAGRHAFTARGISILGARGIAIGSGLKGNMAGARRQHGLLPFCRYRRNSS